MRSSSRKLGLSRKRRGKTGFSTDARVLQAIRDEHPIVPKIERWRELNQLDKTYFSVLPQLVDAEGRIHTTFLQVVAIAGRLASTNPNMQNVPIRTELGQEIRGCFEAAPGNVLLSADYSQIELRVLAHIADEPVLKEIFVKGEDVHTATASQVFQTPPDKLTVGQRSQAKMINYGIVYGLSDFGLADRLGIPREEAKAIIDAYLDRFPRVRAYIEEMIEKGREDGYVTTLWGRRRQIPELKARNWGVRSLGERLAVNSPIQGTAADVLKLAMVRCAEVLRGSPVRQILTVHDELLFEGTPEEIEAVREDLVSAMVGVWEHEPPARRRRGRGKDLARREMTRAQRITLLAAISGSAVAGVDATVVNVALPAIAEDLGGGLAAQQWVVNAYLLTLGSLILIGGSLGDLFGEKRIFMVGVAGFGVVSVLCAVAPTIEVLVLGRALQGAFGALLTPGSLALIVAAFPPDQRGAAIGSWTAWSGIAFVIGPLVGGQLVDALDWRAIFAINVPFVLVTLALATRIEVGTTRRPGAKVDVVGAVLCALGLAGPVLALIEQPARGWGDPLVWGAGLGGLALLACFVLWEARSSHPMLDLGLFRRRNFAVGNLLTFAMYAGLGVVFFLLVLFLQQVAGWDALEAGIATVPTSIVMFVLSRRFGALADRIGPRPLMGFGPLVAAAGMLWLAMLPSDPDYLTDLLPPLLVFSLGLSMTVAPLTAAVLADADEGNAGIASAVNNAIARVAALLATAAIGAAVAAQFSAALDDRLDGVRLDAQAQAVVAEARQRSLGVVDMPSLPAAERAELRSATEAASESAFRLGLVVAAGLVALGGVMALVGIRTQPEPCAAADCAGGQLAGAPLEAAREPARAA